MQVIIWAAVMAGALAAPSRAASRPDLVVSRLANPPATLVPGASFTAQCTVELWHEPLK